MGSCTCLVDSCVFAYWLCAVLTYSVGLLSIIASGDSSLLTVYGGDSVSQTVVRGGRSRTTVVLF
jgi:hypothetical protein